MRAFLCILLMGWLWLPFAARAQSPTITAAEYFINADPGVGKGNAFPVPNSPNPSVQTQVNLQGLPLGFHILGARFQDSNGNWSLARSRVFFVETPPSQSETATLVAFEYFINDDPGTGNATNVAISPGFQASLAIPISLQGLPEGFHTLSVRFQDQNGIWSLAKSRIFIVQNASNNLPLLPITAAEYFIDADPGVGSGISLPVSSGTNPQVIGNISTEGLEPGFHTFSVRFKSQDNKWGFAKNRVFYVGDENFNKPIMVDYVEYFFDDIDPGEGKATEIPLEQPASAISVEELIAVADLSQGTHSITVRIRDTKGIWSPVVSQEFIVGEPQFTVPPKPDLEELPIIQAACAINVADLTAPTATAEDGSIVIGTVDESLFPITKQGSSEITWTFTDISGLKSTQKQLIFLEDSDPPIINIPGRVVLNATAEQCVFSNVDLGEVTASDNCGEPTLTNNAPENFGFGITVVTWTATDAAGNQVQSTQEVEVIDNIAPLITAPADLVIEIPAGSDGISSTNISLGSPFILENCGLQSLLTNAPDKFPVGITEVEWEAVDVAGNIATAIQRVSITTEVLPTILAPAPVNFSTDAGSCEATISNLGTPVVTGENIPEDGISNDAPETFPVGTNLVTWTVIDGKGNIATATQEVTVRDSELPTITAPANVSVLATNARCDASDVLLGESTVADNCEIKSVTNNAPELFPFGNTTVTWTVEDIHGNIATATQVVTVTEDQPPLITAPNDLFVQIAPEAESATGVALGQAEASDNCGIEKIENNAPVVFQLGVTIVTWTATDNSGNTATATQNVTVTREVLPTITAPANITIGNDEGTCEATGIDLGTPEVTGEDIAENGVTNNAPESFPVGTTIVTWTVTDGNGNEATAQQTVTVNDEEKPVISSVSSIETGNDPGSCDAEITISAPAVSDNCDSPTATGTRSDGLALDAPYLAGTTIITWTAADAAGNGADEIIQSVNVSDVEAPSITAPADIVTSIASGSPGATGIFLGNAMASDNCGAPEVSNDAPNIFPLGLTTVTWTATDAAGNTATAEQQVLVTLEDIELPTIQAPANIAVSNDEGTCEATGVELGKPSVTGDIPSDGITNDAPDTFPVGTTTVTWTVTDVNGNMASAEQQVTVNDTEAPFISAPSDVEVGNDAEECSATGVELGQPEFGDNCPGSEVSNDAPETFPLGTTTVTWTVTDASGNTATAVQNVTVKDTEAPSISAAGNITVQTDEGSDTASNVELGTPTVSDNCELESVSNDAPETFPVGLTTVIWTATDKAGNSSTSEQTVTVNPRDVETELPTIVPPANVTVDTDEGQCSASNVDLGMPTVTGNIPQGGITNNAPTTFKVGKTVVTWTVTDVNGNTVTATQTVTVHDNEPPQITAPSDIHVTLPPGQKEVHGLDLGEPEVSDNCKVKKVSNNAPDCFPVGTTKVTWTVTDDCGNKSTVVQLVVVKKAETCEVTAIAKPTVTLKLNSSGKARLTTAMADDGSTATCGPLKLDLSKCDFTCEDLGENTVKLIAKDAEGNRDEVEFQVIVVDESKPKIKVDQSAFVWMMKKGDTFTMPDFKDRVEASDNCGFELHQCPEPGTKFRKPENTFVEFEAKDASGNKAKDKFKFNLLVFKCKVPNKNGRTTGEQELSDMLIVPWNTPFEKAISEGIVFEEGSDPEYIGMINWQMNDYDPLRPGLYRITASLDNEGFEGWKVSLDIPVIVLDKPFAEDIMISRNKVSSKVRNGEIIGSLNTLDPVDNIHTYSMNEHPDFYIEKNVLVWKGIGQPDAVMKVTVHSTDRAGQTISREITLIRELPPGEILIYPNPGREESNLMVQLSGPGKVEIRIFDATGRLVYEEKEQQEGSFVRNLDLRGLSSGMYQVIVQSGNQVMTGRLVKE